MVIVCGDDLEEEDVTNFEYTDCHCFRSELVEGYIFFLVCTLRSPWCPVQYRASSYT